MGGRGEELGGVKCKVLGRGRKRINEWGIEVKSWEKGGAKQG